MDATKAGAGPLRAWWLGRVAYRDAWELQHRLASARAEGGIPDQLLLLEHEPVLTLGRNALTDHLRVPATELEARGIELIRVERGGQVTYHGPGQLVAYPIVSLRARGMMLRAFVAALESALGETCAAFDVAAGPREGHPGCWCDAAGPAPRKIGALGIRVERGVTYHGVALNVSVDLAAFQLIDACGLPGVASTSIAEEAGWGGRAPSTDDVARAAAAFAPALARRLGTPLAQRGPVVPPPRSGTDPVPSPSSVRDVLEAMREGSGDGGVETATAGGPAGPATPGARPGRAAAGPSVAGAA